MKKLKKSITGKYNAEDVDKLLQKVRNDYEQCLKSQKERILILRNENKELSTMLEVYKNNEHYIASALTRAEETAQMILAHAEAQANRRIEQARCEAQQIKTAAEGCYKKLCSLKKASESIYKAVTHVVGEEKNNVRPFTSVSDKTHMY